MMPTTTWVSPVILLLAVTMAAGCGASSETQPANSLSPHSKERGNNRQSTAREAVSDEVETALTLSFNRPPSALLPIESFKKRKLLYATIELTGKLIAETSEYGLLRFDSVKDDQGKVLEVRGAGPTMNDPTRKFIKIGGPFQKKESLTIHLYLQQPSDEAIALAVMSGSVQVLTGGKHKEVIIDNVLGKAGTTLTDPALMAAGLNVMPRVLSKGERLFPSSPGRWVDDPEKTLAVEVGGRYKDSVEDYALLDGTGAKVKLSSWPTKIPSQQNNIYVLETEEGVPQDAKLKLKFSYGQVPVTVPLKFTNVAIGGQ
jgi:hypothetical protein